MHSFYLLNAIYFLLDTGYHYSIFLSCYLYIVHNLKYKKINIKSVLRLWLGCSVVFQLRFDLDAVGFSG